MSPGEIQTWPINEAPIVSSMKTTCGHRAVATFVIAARAVELPTFLQEAIEEHGGEDPIVPLLTWTLEVADHQEECCGKGPSARVNKVHFMSGDQDEQVYEMGMN